ncbi:MAG: ATP-binding protein [Planctomycetaceae bacterium]|jgi:predicted ATP-dependent endonuclease of OLD family|nr:ATP-binding protein [Planctomycetaceae bacterium]
MFFEIDNIGKVRNSRIEMRGITVLAGNNNTGKSTFGKALFCIFNAFFDTEKKVQKERKDNIVEIILRFTSLKTSRSVLIGKIADDILSNIDSSQKIQQIIQDNIEQQIIVPFNIGNDLVEMLFEKIKLAIAVSNEQIQKNILTRYLCTAFDEQITHVNRPDQSASITLTIKNDKLETQIYKNECVNYSDNVGIINKAFYIDTPFILDKIDLRRRYGYSKYSPQHELLQSFFETGEENNIIETEIIKQKSKEVLSFINAVVCGEFKKTEIGLGYQECGLEKPLTFKNVSAGMKTFLIIKRLLENGELKEHDILIFDEPEIHLHPEWQLEFAKLLILLQKELGMTVLLTTHSPYFLNAVEVYSEEQNINDRCNYYLTTNENDYYSARDVTESIDDIYRLLAEPFHKLEKKRYE